MDYYVEQLKMLIEQNGGIVSAGDVQKAGIDRLCLYESLKKGTVLKEFHGNYVLADDQPDEFRVIQSRSDKLIFSHGTALYLHGVSDKVPHDLDITVPQGDNVSRIKKCYENTKFHYCKKELWNLGITTLKTPQGYDVKAYDLERCICDLIKEKDKFEVQTFQTAMKSYMRSSDKELTKLLSYAYKLNMKDEIMKYIEVMI